ncbi:hypothetical protein BC332_25433 [Capsicum chinense]|nr:hypothetical protein BC332_25433 [Capsicum chinense]
MSLRFSNMVMRLLVAHSDCITVLDGNNPYYNIDLKEILAAGKPLKNTRVFGRKHGIILDSGTTYAYLPEAAFIAFKSASKRPNPSFNDICFSRDMAQLPKNFSPIDMVFVDGNKLTLSTGNDFFKHFKVCGTYCIGIFPNGKNPTCLLGGIIAHNSLVTYNRKNERIGFWKTKCSELCDRQNSSPPPPSLSTPVVSSLDNQKYNTHMSPSPAPSGPPRYTQIIDRPDNLNDSVKFTTHDCVDVLAYTGNIVLERKDDFYGSHPHMIVCIPSLGFTGWYTANVSGTSTPWTLWKESDKA